MSSRMIDTGLDNRATHKMIQTKIVEKMFVSSPANYFTYVVHTGRECVWKGISVITSSRKYLPVVIMILIVMDTINSEK